MQTSRFAKLGLVALSALVTGTAFARGGGGLSLGLEPIIGYERVQKLIPTEHTTDRLVYGARLTAGFALLSLEGEYTQSKDSETFTSESLVVSDYAQKAKVGLRSTISLGGGIKAFARGGVQATQNKHIETTSGVETSNLIEPLETNPYAGAGFKVSMSNKISLTGDVVAVFKEWPNMNKNEYMTSLGFEVKVP